MKIIPTAILFQSIMDSNVGILILTRVTIHLTKLPIRSTKPENRVGI